MKIAFAGLISGFLVLAGCVSKTTDATTSQQSFFRIHLNEISKSSAFEKINSQNFKLKSANNILLKAFIYTAKNQTDALSYMQNRKMLLNQNFQNNIAPYIGLLKTNPACMNLAQMDARDITTQDGQYFFMAFPATASATVADCQDHPAAGTIEYTIYYCFNTDTVYEISQYRTSNQAQLKLSLSCL